MTALALTTRPIVATATKLTDRQTEYSFEVLVEDLSRQVLSQLMETARLNEADITALNVTHQITPVGANCLLTFVGTAVMTERPR